MAERLANYYATLNGGGSPFVTLSADQDYQYFPSYPAEVKDAIFVPSKDLAWNAVDSIYLEINGTTIELHHSRRGYNFGSKTFEDTWEGAAFVDDSGSSESGESSETQGIYYHVTATFSDYTAVAIEVEVEDGEGKMRYIGLSSAEKGDVQVELTEATGESYEVSAESESISATLTTSPILTATGAELNFYAVTETYEQYHTVVYKWYDAERKLHEESHTVADGSPFPALDAEPPSPYLDEEEAWEGAWTPFEPSDDTPVDKDYTCEFIYKNTTEKTINWKNKETSPDTSTVSDFHWCHPYPEISPLSDSKKPEGKTLQGVFLYRDGAQVKRIYNTDAQPCANVEELDIADLALEARWIPSAAVVSDQSDLRSLVGAIPSTFATLPTARTEFPSGNQDSSEDSEESEEANFLSGFPPAFETPIGSGGKVITRQMINTLGNLGSQAQFFEQCGGFYTFDKGFSDAIGGYPEGAILQFYQPSTNALRVVRSMHDDNEVNFLEVGVDGVNWEYVGDNPIVSVKVDYSAYEDLSERLFVETGVPDLYEVPYDSYLQAFAVGSVDCDSLRRPPSEDVVRIYDDQYSMSSYPVHINGLYYAEGSGSSFLDIYHGGSQAFGSFLMGGFHPSTMLVWGFEDNIHHAVRSCPLSAFSCGVMLSKGDKIRVRNVITEKNGVVELPTGRNNFVHPMTHGDETIRRKYNYRFAALYRRGLVQ